MGVCNDVDAIELWELRGKLREGYSHGAALHSLPLVWKVYPELRSSVIPHNNVLRLALTSNEWCVLLMQQFCSSMRDSWLPIPTTSGSTGLAKLTVGCYVDYLPHSQDKHLACLDILS